MLSCGHEGLPAFTFLTPAFISPVPGTMSSLINDQEGKLKQSGNEGEKKEEGRERGNPSAEVWV